MDNKAKFKDFSYCYSSDVTLPLTIKIVSLEGHRVQHTYTELVSQPHLQLSGLNLPYYKADLYVTCQLFANGQPLTGPTRTRYQSFTKDWCWNETLTLPIKILDLPVDSQLLFAIYDLESPLKEGLVGSACLNLFTSHCKLRKGRQKLYVKDKAMMDPEEGMFMERPKVWLEIDRLDKLVKKQDSGDMSRVEWLDPMARAEIESIRQRERLTSSQMVLLIDLPKFDFPILFMQQETIPLPSNIPPHVGKDPLTVVIDFEVGLDNPVETKHRRLVRSNRSGPFDQGLKPNADLRDRLNTIIRYPPTQDLSDPEKDVLWKYRIYLTQNKKALPKFLKSVMWDDVIESGEAIKLLYQWAEMDSEDSLELLHKDFRDKAVRRFAVDKLRKANDDDLMLYLLQLVQAVKFDPVKTKPKNLGPSSRFEHPMEGSLSNSGLGTIRDEVEVDEEELSPLARFLIDRSVANPVLGNKFYWYLRVESSIDTNPHSRIYQHLLAQYIQHLKRAPDPLNIWHQHINHQNLWIGHVLNLSRMVRVSKDVRSRKIEKFQAYLKDPKCGLNKFEPIPLPLDAQVMVGGIIPRDCTIFKSNLQPLRLTFVTEDNLPYPVMFKQGDDLRQDQLVIQMIQLMDTLLRRENLDLKLTPYKVLATSIDQGYIQFVPSLPLATILDRYDGSLLMYLQGFSPDSNEALGLRAEVLDNYLKSCAGYCVITYLLGVGDRHLDNLLLTEDGKLFHIDFGYILGRDPKPFPPPMKLCKEMVEAMGGSHSSHYKKFQSYCYICFNSLRKQSNLILNLLSLMVDSNIQDIAVEPDKAVMKVQEKFCLELSDEEAIQYFQSLIDESVSALFPQVIETIHKWAQYWRN